MDSATASGYEPEYVSEEILKAVIHGKKDLVIAPIVPRIAIWLRSFAPCIYFRVMEKRARKSTE